MLFQLIPAMGRGSGGSAFAFHLYHGLRMAGFVPHILKVGKKSGGKPREFVNGVEYTSVSIDDAVKLSGQHRSLILYSHFKHFEEETLSLLDAGVPIVFHATAELKHADLLSALRGKKVAAVRRPIADWLTAAGASAVFVPHPYVRRGPAEVRKMRRAANIARIDFCKHTDVIAGANVLSKRKVDIFGSINRMFAFNVLDKQFEGWREHYMGTFRDGEGFEIAATSEMVVDLTYWKGDGAGSQYTFLEAWDAGTPLVVHRRWTEAVFDPDERAQVVDGRNALSVESAEALAKLVDYGPGDMARKVVASGFDELKHFDAKAVAAEYAEMFGW